MTSDTQPPAIPYRPEHAIDEVADFLADPVAAADFPAHTLRWRNDRAAAEVGLDTLSDDDWVRHFGRFEPLPGSLPQPLALRYHGHQFRAYNPDIGDGRGFLFAQLRDDRGRLMDLGTKGSGTTPYSRSGDGRLTLKGAVREVLATEMLEALGVPTSRTFSVIETGEALHRGDEPSPTRAAVLVRLNHGHIRIGSFQRLAVLRQVDELARLVSYANSHFYGDNTAANACEHLFARVVPACARLAAGWMAAGFVHGVLNTDNINVTGESFDYGPWRFAPSFDPGFTAAYFDHGGLYAYARQAEAMHWNLVQLAIALRSLIDTEPLAAALEGFAPAYREALVERTLWRLGVASRGFDQDTALVAAMETALIAARAPLDRFFFDWRGGDLRYGSETYAGPEWQAFSRHVIMYEPAAPLHHPYWSGDPCSMLIDEVEAIWAPIAAADDWSRLHAKVAAIRSMGEALGAMPPPR